MSEKMTQLGFITAAMMNIGGAFIFSLAFTNSALNAADPVVMSNFGLVMIIIWGFAYLAATFIKANIQWLAAVFAVQKLAYVVAWLLWVSNNSLSAVFEDDLLAGMFFSVYGPNDMAFMLFFMWVFIDQSKTSKH